MADYGLALAPTPKILPYGPTRTSRRWHGMQEGWLGSGWLGIKGMYIYIQSYHVKRVLPMNQFK